MSKPMMGSIRSSGVGFGAALFLAATLAWSQSPAPMAPDNTGTNKADLPNSAMTADAQKNDSSDLALTQKIRKRLMADKSLSTYAHNVKIISVDGTVTLNGVVRSNREKTRVASLARQSAGKGHVVNALKVSSSGS